MPAPAGISASASAASRPRSTSSRVAEGATTTGTPSNARTGTAGVANERGCPGAGNSPRDATRWSAARSASAQIVLVGFAAPAVTKTLPSTMPRLGTSCAMPHGSTTDAPGSVPIRAVPMK
jgi:hypothetical protein